MLSHPFELSLSFDLDLDPRLGLSLDLDLDLRLGLSLDLDLELDLSRLFGTGRGPLGAPTGPGCWASG